MTPSTRFTFFHDTVSPSGTVVNQPLGWRDIVLSLTRDPAFHSLVEYFKGGFVWYGSARTFIMDCEDADGPEVKIRCLIEIRYNTTWSTIFDGLIDVSQKEELSMANRFYKYAAPIIRNDFWATFMNRRTVKVNLEDTVDLEGNARTAVNKITLPLTKQYLTQKLTQVGTNSFTDSPTSITSDSGVIQLAFPFTVEELGEALSIEFIDKTGVGDVEAVLKTLFKGDIIITVVGTIRVEATASVNIDSFSAGISCKLNNGSTVGIDGDTLTPAATSMDDTITINDSHTFTPVVVGDEIKLFSLFAVTLASSGDVSYTLTYDLSLEISQETYIEDTETDAYLIKDAFESVLSKIIGQDDVVESTMFTTCKRLNAVFRGIHGRGFAFTDKPFTTSFDELWKGFEPVANIGLGYTEVAGVKKIQIENKSFFYGQTPSVFLSNVSGLTRRYDLEKHYKTIEVGYSKRFIEAAGGVDDPQTLSSWRTKFRTIGNDLKIISTFFLASLGIEQNRRNRVELNKDGKIDEDIIMVSVKSDGGSGYTPEVGTDFNAVSNLLNSDTRYNIRHTCARIFKRWQSFIQGCLQHTTGEAFYYSGGEGNRTMSSQFETTDCEATDDPEPVLVEDAHIAVSTTDYLFIPKVFKCKVPMSKVTYDAILADKENAIAISQDATTYIPMHILDFDYKIFGGYADLTLLQASNSPVIPEGEFMLMEDGNIILDENGDGILME